MFLLVSGRHVGAHLGGHQHGVSIQISINLGKTFLLISSVRKLESWRESLHIYLLSISRFQTYSIEWFLFFILIYFEWRDTENQQQDLNSRPLVCITNQPHSLTPQAQIRYVQKRCIYVIQSTTIVQPNTSTRITMLDIFLSF